MLSFASIQNKDYGPISVLLEKKGRTANPQWVADEWDQMGRFYASCECGHATASTRAQTSERFYREKNHFYRANRELGRIIRTEHTLNFMSDPDLRRRARRGLLKKRTGACLGKRYSIWAPGTAQQSGMGPTKTRL